MARAMHPNPIFRQTEKAAARDFASERGFGQLSVNGENGPLAAHVPFLLQGEAALLHLVRSNPVLRALKDGPLPAVIAVTGPDSYVSPDWYVGRDQVPTWNYVAVHLRGRLERLPDEALRRVIDRQSAFFEARLAPKTPWTTGKLTPEVLTRMVRAIAPCRLLVEDIASTFKLSQNKTVEDRTSAAHNMKAHDIGSEPHIVAALMLGIGEKEE